MAGVEQCSAMYAAQAGEFQITGEKNLEPLNTC